MYLHYIIETNTLGIFNSIYRFYRSGRNHFYYFETATPTAYIAEGKVFCTVKSPEYVAQTLAPLYRLYSGLLDDHFYTASEDEKTAAQQGNYGYSFEADNGYVLPTASIDKSITVNNGVYSFVVDLIPLHRYYSIVITDHFYTVNQQDPTLIGGYNNFVYEGIAGYVLDPAYC